MDATEFGVYIVREYPSWKVEMLHPNGAIFSADNARVYIEQGSDKGVWDVSIHIRNEHVRVIISRTFRELQGDSPATFAGKVAGWVVIVLQEVSQLLKRISSQPEGGA